MPDIREKPTTVREKSVKPKGRTSGKAIHAASRQITAKYRKELARHDQKKFRTIQRKPKLLWTVPHKR